jgi:type II secretory pathway pseudopilin PulG
MNRKSLVFVLGIVIAVFCVVMVATMLKLSTKNNKDENIVNNNVVENEEEEIDSSTEDNSSDTDTSEEDKSTSNNSSSTDNNSSSSNNSSTNNKSSNSSNNSSTNNSSSNSSNNKSSNSNSNNSNNSTNNSTSTVVNNGNLILSCDSDYFSSGGTISCTLKGKVSEYKVSAVSLVINDNNFNIGKVTVGTDFLGDGDNGKVDIYTDKYKSGEFEIVSFTISTNSSSSELKLDINDVVFVDSDFVDHNISSISKTFKKK